MKNRSYFGRSILTQSMGVEMTSETLNLRQAFEKLVLPVKTSRKGTVSASRAAIKWLFALVPEVAEKPYDQIGNRELVQFRGAWPKTELKPQTFNKYLRHLRSIFRDLEEQEYIAKAPRCRELPEDDIEVRIASQVEIERLYLHASVAQWPKCRGITAESYWRSLIAVAYATGLRRSDLLNIKPENVNLNDRVLIYRAVKTSKQRSIPLVQFACHHLSSMMKKTKKGEPVFYSTGSRRQFYREWHRIQKSAKVDPPIDIHDLRRTCGSHVYTSAGLNSASEMLAHSSTAITRKHYIASAAAAESLRPAVDTMKDPSEVLKRRPETPENGAGL